MVICSVIIQWAAAVEWTIPKDITRFSEFFYVLWQLLSSENKIISLIIKNKTGEKNPQNYNLCKQ